MSYIFHLKPERGTEDRFIALQEVIILRCAGTLSRGGPKLIRFVSKSAVDGNSYKGPNVADEQYAAAPCPAHCFSKILLVLCTSDAVFFSDLLFRVRFLQADKSGRTALHWASISGHQETAELLVERGANLMAETSSKMTPLHGAAEGGRAELIRLFLTKGDKDALVNARDADNKTPFDLAMQGKHAAVVKALKEMGDPNAQGAACCVM